MPATAPNPRVLLTAFEPYDGWHDNASWRALIEFTRALPPAPQVVTRRYPVDYEAAQRELVKDLAGDFDFALHLGQAPGAARLQLEAIAVNVRGPAPDDALADAPLDPNGPAAYVSPLPLHTLSRKLREAGLPAQVSHHAGVYLCNAVLYWSLQYADAHKLKTRAMFLHVPLDPAQVLDGRNSQPSFPAFLSALALRVLLEEFCRLHAETESVTAGNHPA